MGEWGASFHPSTCQCLPRASPITQAGCCVLLHSSDLPVGQEQGSLHCAPGDIFSLVSNPRWRLGGSSELQMFKLQVHLAE